MARWFITAGMILVILGTIIHFAPWTISWFGKLPGDIRIETEKGVFFMPLASMLVISVILSILIGILKRF